MSAIDFPRKKSGDPVTAKDWNYLCDCTERAINAILNRGVGSLPAGAQQGYTAPRRDKPCSLLSIFKDTKGIWSMTLAPFTVSLKSIPTKLTTPKSNSVEISKAPYPVFDINKSELWLVTDYKKTGITGSKIEREKPKDKPADGEKRDLLLLGKFELEDKEPRWKPYHEGNLVIDDTIGALDCPFQVAFTASETEGGAPSFTVAANGGTIGMIGDGTTEPFANSSSSTPSGMYIYDASLIVTSKPFSGKFAYLVASYTYSSGSVKVKFTYEGSPYEAMLCECDDKGRPSKSRVCLAQYGGSQYVSTSLYLSPVFFGSGGYYIFTPFLSNPKFVA